MKALLVVLFLLVFQTVRSQEKLVEEFPDVFVTAAEEQKSVVFIFDHPNCGWCRVFDNYHASPKVKEILDPEYLIQKIDISEFETGMSLYEYYEFPGVPVWIIFTSRNEVISNENSENGFFIGYPCRPKNVELYLDAISKSSRHITKKQLHLLGEKLVHFGDE